MADVLGAISRIEYNPIKVEKIDNLKNIVLRDYQMEGVQFLAQRYLAGHGCILADEMGLGKTCTCLSTILYLKQIGAINRTLIVSPLSVVDHWKTEIEHVGISSTSVVSILGSQEQRSEAIGQYETGSCDLVLTTYDIILRLGFFLNHKWSLVVFDEAHRLKNQDSQANQMALELDCSCRLLLTGTPIQNNLRELFSLLRVCDPEIFVNESQFLTLSESDLTRVLSTFMLRRTKAEIDDQLNLVAKSEVTIDIKMTDLQRRIYLDILRKHKNAVAGIDRSISLINILMQLRKCALHPYLFRGVEPEPFTSGEHIVTASAKTIVLDRILPYILANNHKCLIFSQFTGMLDIVQDYMDLRGYSYERLDGSIRGQDRFDSIRNFNEQSTINFFLLSTKAGGTGLNLLAADTVIFLDLDFNPQNDLQAAARCHRIGQTRRVKIIKLLCSGSVDQIIHKRAKSKLELSERVLGSKDLNDASCDEIRAMIQYGIDELVDGRKDEDVVGWKGIEEIVSTDEDGQWSMEIVKSSVIDEPISDMYYFEGVSYATVNKKRIEEILGINDSSTDLPKKRALAPKTRKIDRELLKIRKNLLRAPRTCPALVKTQVANEDFLNDIENSIEDLDVIRYVTGDVTFPVRQPDTNPVIVITIDDSGEYPRASKLYSRLSTLFPDLARTYELAGLEEDLCLSDVHLHPSKQLTLALLVCQNHDQNHRMSLTSFELCLRTLDNHFTGQKCDLHFARPTVDSKTWYSMERLIQTRLSIPAHIYYHRKETKAKLNLYKIPDVLGGVRVHVRVDSPEIKRLVVSYGGQLDEVCCKESQIVIDHDHTNDNDQQRIMTTTEFIDYLNSLTR